MKSLKFLAICLLISSLVACAAPAASPTAVPPTAAPAKPAATAEPTKAPPTAAPATATPALTAAQQWAKANGLGPYQPATEDWAAVEAAAKKEGKVVVYANSSKFEKLIEPWAALYPDIKLEGGDTDGITTKMQAEQQAGNVVGDVWFNSDGHILYGQFAPKQWIWSYLPPGLKEADVTPQRPFAVAAL